MNIVDTHASNDYIRETVVITLLINNNGDEHDIDSYTNNSNITNLDSTSARSGHCSDRIRIYQYHH